MLIAAYFFNQFVVLIFATTVFIYVNSIYRIIVLLFAVRCLLCSDIEAVLDCSLSKNYVGSHIITLDLLQVTYFLMSYIMSYQL